MSPNSVTEEPAELARTNSGSVILFDPVTQELKTEKKKRFEASKATFQALAPNIGSRANIYDEENSSLLVASLRLDKLGWSASWQRFWGKCNEIYTINPEESKPQPQVAAAA